MNLSNRPNFIILYYLNIHDINFIQRKLGLFKRLNFKKKISQNFNYKFLRLQNVIN